jgi:two-component sensor histidine kinase
LIIGYRSFSHSYLVLALLTIVGVLGIIILYGGVIIRHELRHRRDRELLETRVRERTAELERSVAERSVMLQEIHHRVKNNLQIITSILRLEVDRQADATSRAAIEASIQRIFAMALVHETLYDTDQLESIDLVNYTGELLNLARDVSPIRFDLKAEGPIPVGLDFAVPFGILLNELVSNAEKHAFPQGAPGEVDIRIDSTEGILLSFADDGIGIPERIGLEGAKTLGLTLVKVLVQQLHGSIVLDRSSGTRWTIRFPEP